MMIYLEFIKRFSSPPLLECHDDLVNISTCLMRRAKYMNLTTTMHYTLLYL